MDVTRRGVVARRMHADGMSVKDKVLSSSLKFTVLLLLSFVLLPTARADSVAMDNFVYTGFGATYSWTLPATIQVPDANAFLLYPVSVVMSAMPEGFTSIPFDMHFERDFPNFIMGCGLSTPNWDYCYFIPRIDSTINEKGQFLWNGSGHTVHFNTGSFADGQLVVTRAGVPRAAADPVNTPEPETQFLTLAGLLLLAPGLCLKRGITAANNRSRPAQEWQ